MIGALALTFHSRGLAALSATVPSNVTDFCTWGGLTGRNQCQTSIPVTCTPVGGSGSFAFNWEFVENNDNFSMDLSENQTVYVSKTGIKETPGYTCIIRCLITDNVGGAQVYSNPCTVTSNHSNLD